METGSSWLCSWGSKVSVHFVFLATYTSCLPLWTVVVVIMGGAFVQCTIIFHLLFLTYVVFRLAGLPLPAKTNSHPLSGSPISAPPCFGFLLYILLANFWSCFYDGFLMLYAYQYWTFTQLLVTRSSQWFTYRTTHMAEYLETGLLYGMCS